MLHLQRIFHAEMLNATSATWFICKYLYFLEIGVTYSQPNVKITVFWNLGPDG